MKHPYYAFIAAVILLVSGCMTGGPPTVTEQKLYDIKTNLVEVAVPTTTNVIEGELVVIPGITSVVEQYEYLPSDRQAAIQGTAKVIGDFWGVGGLASTIIGGLFGLWGTWRSRKSGKAAAALVQVIETGRQILQTTPQGQRLDQKWLTWMMKHQVEQGVINEVVKLVGTASNSEEAKQVADKLLELMNREG